MTLQVSGAESYTQSYLTYLLLKQLPHLSPSGLPPNIYTLAHTNRGKLHGSQLPPLVALGKATPSSSSSSRITSVSSSGSLVRERLEEVLVIRGRGFTRTPHLDEHPPLDIVDENEMPQYLQTLHEPVSSVNTTPASSGRSSPSIETHSTLSASHGGWTTGNTTERSSLDSSYSWDEFDRQAAKTVNLHFDEIDRFLFGEGSTETPLNIVKLCQDWSSHFHHLRIVGAQKVEPKDVGYREFPRDSPRLQSPGLLLDVTDNDISASADSQGLSLTGRSLKPMKAPVDVSAIHPDRDYSNNEYSYLMEEVFEQDGVYEEIIAVDYKDVHEDSEHKKQITPRRRRIGYPPITPNACVKDTVASSVFDCIWNEIISWMRTILKKYSTFLSDKQQLVPSSVYIPTIDPGPSLRESSYFGLPARNSQGLTLQRAHTHIGTTGPNKSIDGILQISGITLKTKNAPDPSETELVSPARPNSSMTSRRPTSVNRSQQAGGGRIRKLAPIQPNRANTPSVDEEMPINAFSVKRLTPFQKNTALPPLGSGYDTQLDKPKRKISSVRASSAIDNKDGRSIQFNRERSNTSIEHRPSTTHTMRSDTPFQLGSSGRRSSTPFSGLNRGMLHGSKALGITGSSLQQASEIGNLPPNIMEDESMDTESPIHTNWPLKTRARPVQYKIATG